MNETTTKTAKTINDKAFQLLLNNEVDFREARELLTIAEYYNQIFNKEIKNNEDHYINHVSGLLTQLEVITKRIDVIRDRLITELGLSPVK
ncbi:MAG: hypothetical protein K8F60_16310 [Melioribacteraceae bacterium]|jgi:hypothetical protein|nr:hypothetical protein [Melioribacteraceae bacterium]